MIRSWWTDPHEINIFACDQGIEFILGIYVSQLQTANKPVNGNSVPSQTQINYELFKMVVLSENSTNVSRKPDKKGTLN